jgi:hypothetical protein
VAFGFMPLGAAVSGFLLEWIGPVPTILAFALWYLVFAILTTLNRHVRNARPLAHVAED